jgi:hypothetical protein
VTEKPRFIELPVGVFRSVGLLRAAVDAMGGERLQHPHLDRAEAAAASNTNAVFE